MPNAYLILQNRYFAIHWGNEQLAIADGQDVVDEGNGEVVLPCNGSVFCVEGKDVSFVGGDEDKTIGGGDWRRGYLVAIAGEGAPQW